MNRRFCKVKLHFNGEYKMELKEVPGCYYYHGAAGEFSSIVLRGASGLKPRSVIFLSVAVTPHLRYGRASEP